MGEVPWTSPIEEQLRPDARWASGGWQEPPSGIAGGRFLCAVPGCRRPMPDGARYFVILGSMKNKTIVLFFMDPNISDPASGKLSVSMEKGVFQIGHHLGILIAIFKRCDQGQHSHQPRLIDCKRQYKSRNQDEPKNYKERYVFLAPFF